MEFRVLGPLHVHDGTGVRPVTSAASRILLSGLLLRCGQPASVAEMSAWLWGSDTAAPNATVRSYVMRLRRALGAAADTLTSHAGGYVLSTDPRHLDAARFTARRDDGCRAMGAGDWATAGTLLDEALAEWRGDALQDVASDQLHAEHAHRLAEQRAQTEEWRVTAKLHLGRHGELISHLYELVAAYPLRETLTEQLMLALYRNGRRADALETFRATRELLVRELGIEPGPALQDTHRKVLAGDEALLWTAPTAAVAVSRPRNDLPRGLADFTGRDAEVLELTAHARGGGPVATVSVIDGMAGVGKTALAMRVAHQLAPYFPDGQLCLDLHGYTPDQEPLPTAQALHRLLTAVGVPDERVAAGPDDRAAQWRAELADRRVLVVLDNAVDAAQVAPLLVGAPGCHMIVTSRQRLYDLDGAHFLSLDVLDAPDAVDLFVRIAGAGRCAGQTAEAFEVVQACGRLPLAVRIAAARLKHRPTWTIRYLLEQLRDCDLVTEHTDAAIGVSYRHLTGAQRYMFCALGLHPGTDIDLWAAAALAGRPPAPARRALEELVDHHMLEQPLPGRFAFHDVLRGHAGRLAADEGIPRTPALARLRDHYRDTAAAAMDLIHPHEHDLRPRAAASTIAFDGPRAAIGWLDGERYNLIDVARQAVAERQPAWAGMLSNMLWRHLETQAHYEDAVTLHHVALRAATDAGDLPGQGDALRHLGKVYFRLSRLDQSVEHLTAALDIARRTGDRVAEAGALGNLANACAERGQLREALRYHQQSAAIDRGSGDRSSLASVYAGIGTTHARLGEYEEAVRHLRHALELNRANPNHLTEGHAHTALGMVFTRTGDTAQAIEHLRHALDIHRTWGFRAGEANSLTSLGMLYARSGDIDLAADHYERAETLYEEIGNRGRQGHAILGIGYARQLAGDHHRAIERYRDALAIGAEIGDRVLETEALNGAGASLRCLDRLDDALHHHTTALAHATEVGARHEEARAHDGIADIHRRRGEDALARTHWEQALDHYRALGAPEAEAVEKQLAASV
ncbi:tetratricopeptide repeat protein [Longispora fulva]|uniref:AfsR/SARP family transcriptional regulator n=1 Tax=Longispora fulva TaxID=619741 RepID=UPI0018CA26EE|nr:tetratricopeptide repeat protein [Longispora fulva]